MYYSVKLFPFKIYITSVNIIMKKKKRIFSLVFLHNLLSDNLTNNYKVMHYYEKKKKNSYLSISFNLTFGNILKF